MYAVVGAVTQHTLVLFSLKIFRKNIATVMGIYTETLEA